MCINCSEYRIKCCPQITCSIQISFFFFLLKCNVHLSDCLLSFSQCVLTILCTLQCTSNFSSDDQRVAVLFIPFWREFTQDGQLLRRGLSSTVTAGRHCGNGSPELNQQL